jgi:hypothetical protein
MQMKKTAKVHVRRHGNGLFVASATLKGEKSPHFDSDPEGDPDVAAARAKSWATVHGVKVTVVTLEAGIRGVAAVGEDHVEAP